MKGVKGSIHIQSSELHMDMLTEKHIQEICKCNMSSKQSDQVMEFCTTFKYYLKREHFSQQRNGSVLYRPG